MKELLLEIALEERNRGWRDHPLVPSWVDLAEVGIDAFYTRPSVAVECHAELIKHMREDGARPSRYRFVEPSAGTGSFYNLLPESRRIGVDLIPYSPDYITTDFLSWTPPDRRRPSAVIGNPPFGYRGWLALAFMNHIATFADYVGLILPMSFQSDGKGSPKLRVRGLRLQKTMYLSSDAFTDIDGRPFKVNALFQVWQRGVNNFAPQPRCDDWLDIFTVDNRKERLCGQTRLHEADFFLQRPFYDEPPTLVEDFADVRYVCGYGLVFKRSKQKLASVLGNADWRKYSNLATHNCRHISMYHIRRVLTDAGFHDARD